LKSNYFASCPRGLEALLVKELEALKIESPNQVDGGVEFSCSIEQMYRTNITSRVATRVMMRIKKGTYETEDDLYQAALEINWFDYFDLSNSIKVSTTGVKCPLKSLDFMTLRIKDAVCDSFRKKMNKRPDVDIRNPDIRIHLYLEKNEYFIYLDTSGDPLYQRGFRKSSVEAPIKENLAAGIILLSGWEPGQAMLDPMCGSGTFLIEASMMALNQMPGLRRNFGFENWKNLD
jgi:putative N6-adenine-specific DNA methylase